MFDWLIVLFSFLVFSFMITCCVLVWLFDCGCKWGVLCFVLRVVLIVIDVCWGGFWLLVIWCLGVSKRWFGLWFWVWFVCDFGFGCLCLFVLCLILVIVL